MKKQILSATLFLGLLFILISATTSYFQSYSLGNTAKQISVGACNLNRLNVINTSTTTVYLKLYDYRNNNYTVAPTHTVNPKYILQVPPYIESSGNYFSEVWNNTINSPSTKTVMTFTAGCWVRVVQGFAPTNTITPLDTVYIDVEY